MSNQLDIFTFGTLRLEVNGSVVSGFISRKVEALAVYLALEPREHPRELLAEMFWPDRPAAQSLNNLRSALHNLQQKLGSCVEITRQSVQINPACSLCVDANQLEEGFALVGRKLASGQSLTRLGAVQVESLITLYKGEFLEGFYVKDSDAFEDWMVSRARYLREIVLEAHRWLVTYYAHQHEFPTGIRHAQGLLRLDPLDEQTHRQLMLMLAHNGQRAAALSQYKTLQTLLQEELDVDPEYETVDLFEQLQAGDILPLGAVQKPAPNVPLSSTPFVGREEELTHIKTLLDDPNCRVLTITGPGGIGKTRLAAHIAAQLAQDFSDGAFFCALAGVDSPRLFAPALSEALGISAFDDRPPTEPIISYLQDKQLLLVIDNCEHLLSVAAQISEIVMHTTHVKFLITSRERLNLQEEWLFPLNGFDYPQETEPTDQDYEAIRFFAQTAQRVQSNFDAARHLPSIAKICRLVEGFPLGLELAASWLRLMSPAEVGNQISSSLDLLNSSSQNIPERHRSIRATFEASWRLLSDTEQETLGKLSIFRGSFDRAAAQQIANTTPMLLRSLFDKSFLRKDADDRMSIHELIRRYSLEKLEAAGGLQESQERHFAYYASISSRAAAEIETEKERAWLVLLDLEIDNIFAALAYCLSAERYDSYVAMLYALQVYWLGRGELWQELRRSVLAIIGKVQSEMGLLQARYLLGHLEFKLGAQLTAIENFQQVVNPASAAGMFDMAASAWCKLGWIAYLRGDREKALHDLELSVQMAHRSEDAARTAETLHWLSRFHEKMGKYDLAAKYVNESMDIAQEIGCQSLVAINLLGMGNIAYKQLQIEQSFKHYEEAYRLFQELGNLQEQARALDSMSMSAVFLDNHDYALWTAQQALAISVKAGNTFTAVHAMQRLCIAEMMRDNLDEARSIVIEAIGIAQAVSPEILGTSFLNLVRVEVRAERYERAALFYGVGQSLHGKAGISQAAPFRKLLDVIVDTLKAELGEAAFQSLYERGTQMEVAEAIRQSAA